MNLSYVEMILRTGCRFLQSPEKIMNICKCGCDLECNNNYVNGHSATIFKPWLNRNIADPINRIKSMILISKSGCWEWQGCKASKTKLRNYGKLIIGSRLDKTRKSITAHRYSYQIFKGEIPSGLWVLHKCDNPPCVNPDHLFLGNRKDNTDDRESKGRNKIEEIRKYGEDHPGAILNWDLVKLIRKKHLEGFSITAIAKELALNRRMINDVTLYRTWKLPQPPKE